jgi:hypothetical protein
MWCRASLIALVASALAALVPLASASPPDPTWIGGLWDGADFDDVVGLAASETVAVDAFPLAGACAGLVPLAPVPAAGARAVASRTPGASQARSPPVS